MTVAAYMPQVAYICGHPGPTRQTHPDSPNAPPRSVLCACDLRPWRPMEYHKGHDIQGKIKYDTIEENENASCWYCCLGIAPDVASVVSWPTPRSKDRAL